MESYERNVRVFGRSARTDKPNMVATKRGGIPPPKPDPDAVRTEITRFTRRSKKSFIESLVSIPEEFLLKCWFVTLTYHYDVLAKQCKEDLRMFWQKCQRQFGASWCIWAFEQQKRGVWHFHLLVRIPRGYSLRGRKDCWKKQWVSDAWADIVQHHAGRDDAHRRAGTNVKRVTKRRIGEYMSKPGSKVAREMSKNIQKASARDLPGRWWGVKGRSEWNKERVVEDYYASNQYDIMSIIQRYWMAKLPDAEWYRWPSYCDDDGVIQDVLAKLQEGGSTKLVGLNGIDKRVWDPKGVDQEA